MNSMLSVSSSQLKSPSLTSKSSNLQSLCQRRFALTRELAQIAARGLAREAWIWGLPVKEFIGQCARSGLSCFSGKSVISFKSAEGLGDNCSIIIILEGKLSVQTEESLEYSSLEEQAQPNQNHYLSVSECVRNLNQIVLSETDTVLLGLSFSQQLSARILDIEGKWIGMLGRNSVLSSWNQQKVKELLRNSKMRNLRLGEILVEEGDTAECVFFVLRGAFSALTAKGNSNDSLPSQRDKKHIQSLLTLSLSKVQSISRSQISPFILCRTEDSETDHGLCSSRSCRFSWTMKSQERLRTQEILRATQDSDISEFSDFEKKKKEDNSSDSSCSSGKEKSEKGCDLGENRGSQKVLNISEGELIGDERICCLRNDHDQYMFRVKCTSIEGGLLLEVPRSIVEQHQENLYLHLNHSKDSEVQQKIFLEKKLAQYNRESFPKGIPTSPDFSFKSTSQSKLQIASPIDMRSNISVKRSPSLNQFTRSETSINCTLESNNRNEESFLSPILLKCSKTQLQCIGQKLKQTNSGNRILEQSSQDPVAVKNCNENMQNIDEQRSIIESEQQLISEKTQEKGNSIELSEEQHQNKPLFLSEEKKGKKNNIRYQMDEIFPACLKQILLKPSQEELHHYATPQQINYPIRQAHNSSFSQSLTADSSINSIFKSQKFSPKNRKQNTKQSIEAVKSQSQENLNSNSLNRQKIFHKSLLTNDLRLSLKVNKSYQMFTCSSSEKITQSSSLREKNNSKSNLSFNENMPNNTKRNQWKQLFSPGFKSHPEFGFNEVTEVHRPVSLCVSESVLKKCAVPQRRWSDVEDSQESQPLNKQELSEYQDKKEQKAHSKNETALYESDQKQNSRQEQINRSRSLGCFSINQMIENNQNREKDMIIQKTEILGNPVKLQEKETELYNYRTDNHQVKLSKLSVKSDQTEDESSQDIRSCPVKQSLKLNFNWNETETFDFDDSTCKEIEESNNCNKKNSNTDNKLNVHFSSEFKAKCLQRSIKSSNSSMIPKNNFNSSSNRFSKSNFNLFFSTNIPHSLSKQQDLKSSSLPLNNTSCHLNLGIIQTGQISKLPQQFQPSFLRDQQKMEKFTTETGSPRNNESTQDSQKSQKNANAINRIFKTQHHENIFD